MVRVIKPTDYDELIVDRLSDLVKIMGEIRDEMKSIGERIDNAIDCAYHQGYEHADIDNAYTKELQTFKEGKE